MMANNIMQKTSYEFYWNLGFYFSVGLFCYQESSHPKVSNFN